MDGFTEIARFTTEQEARGFEFTLRNVGLRARAFHVWEGQGQQPGWYWVVLAPDPQARRAQEILREEQEGGSPAPVRPGPAPAASGKPGAHWVIGLVVACLLVWVAMEGSGGSETRQTLLRFGASHAPSVLAGEVWRTVTAVFLHIGFKHLLANMVSLVIFGIFVLRGWGVGLFFAVFLGAGLLGNLVSLGLAPSAALKAGASGGILGLLGALAGARIRDLRQPDQLRPSRFKTWHVVAMLVAYYGFVVGVGTSSDHLAHVGGLAAGLAFGLLVPGLGWWAPRLERRVSWIAGTVAVALAVTAGALQLALG